MNINSLSLSWRALLPLTVIVLAGCSAMGRSECEVSDWRSVGFEDGARGASVARIGDYRKACAKHGVTPDLEAYRAGYAQGVETYCRAANGFNLGSSGGAYGGMCPGELEGEFLSGYQSGRQLYELNAAVNVVTSQIAGKRHTLSEVREAQSEKEAALLDKDTRTMSACFSPTTSTSSADVRASSKAKSEHCSASSVRDRKSSTNSANPWPTTANQHNPVTVKGRDRQRTTLTIPAAGPSVFLKSLFYICQSLLLYLSPCDWGRHSARC
jgi:hypothetical protein